MKKPFLSQDAETPTEAIAEYLKLQSETTPPRIGREYEGSELYKKRRDEDEDKTWWGSGCGNQTSL